jgi:hypothetical protein
MASESTLSAVLPLRSGSTYDNITGKGNARLHLGDSYNNNVNISMAPSSHWFNCIHLTQVTQMFKALISTSSPATTAVPYCKQSQATFQGQLFIRKSKRGFMILYKSAAGLARSLWFVALAELASLSWCSTTSRSSRTRTIRQRSGLMRAQRNDLKLITSKSTTFCSILHEKVPTSICASLR